MNSQSVFHIIIPDLINSSSPASTVKTIDHDLHCYHFYGNNARRLIVPQVKKKMFGACVSFEILSSQLIRPTIGAAVIPKLK